MVTRELIDEAAVAATLAFKECNLSFERLQEIAEAVHRALLEELDGELE